MSSKAGIGIAITTYNRREQLLKLVTSLRAHTQPRVPVVVFDDGGSDGSREAVAPLVSAYIQAENRGITVNKNRALYYFCKIRPAKRVLILEDDLEVTEPGWLKVWKRAVDHHGHINLALQQGSKSRREFQGGRGTPKHPKRWIAAGHGRAITPRGRVYFALSRGLTLQPAQSSAAAEQIASNREVFLALREAGYPRAQRPWLTPETRRDFLQPFRQLASGAPGHGR